MNEKVTRTENKYAISYEAGSKLQNNLNKILKRDQYSQEHSYIVRSLYFDSINNIDYQTKLAGTEKRKKIRIRTYNPKADKCKLEMKKKQGDLQEKISLWITKEDAQKLALRKFEVLKKYFKDAKEAIEIYTTMVLGCYRPVLLIEYDRVAYVCKEFNTRITLDTNIRSTEVNFELFSNHPLYTPILKEQMILEVKYNGHLMGFINDLLKPYSLNRISVSKYCLGRKIQQEFDF